MFLYWNTFQHNHNFPSPCSSPLWPSGHHVRSAVRLHAEPHPEGENKPPPSNHSSHQASVLHPPCILSWLSSSRLVWNTCGITSRSGRTTSSRLTPCDTPPSAWAEPSEGKPTTAWWSLPTRWVHIQDRNGVAGESCSAEEGVRLSSPLSAALRPSGQTREAPSLDSGAHQRRQPESHRGRDHPALQALPATDGSAVQTGSLTFLLPNINHWGVANTNGRKPGNLCIVIWIELEWLNYTWLCSSPASRTHCYITHKNVNWISFLCILVMFLFFSTKSPGTPVITIRCVSICPLFDKCFGDMFLMWTIYIYFPFSLIFLCSRRTSWVCHY